MGTETVTQTCTVRIGRTEVTGPVVAYVPSGRDAHRALSLAVPHVQATQRKFEPMRSIDRVIVAVPRGTKGKLYYYAADAAKAVNT